MFALYGELLNNDTAVLSHYGIKKDLSIVHLFPKLTVVIDRSSGGGENEDTSLCSNKNKNDNNANNNESAHIPQILRLCAFRLLV